MKIKSIYKLNASVLEILLSDLHKKKTIRLSLINPIGSTYKKDLPSLGIKLALEDSSVYGDLEDGLLTYAECDEDCLVLIEYSEDYQDLAGRLWKASDIIRKSTNIPNKIIVAANEVIVYRSNMVTVV